MDADGRELLLLAFDRMQRVAIRIGMGMRRAFGDAGPFRPPAQRRRHQTEIEARAIRCLQIVDAREFAAVETARQSKPARHVP